MMVHDGDKAMHRKLEIMDLALGFAKRLLFVLYRKMSHCNTGKPWVHKSILTTLVFRSRVFGENLLWIPLPCLIVFFFFIMRQKINHRGKKWLHSCFGASWLQGIGRTGEGMNKSWTFGQRSSFTFFFPLLQQIIKSLFIDDKLLTS